MEQIGPSAQYFVFLDGAYLGKQVVDNFGLPEEYDYTTLGRARITMEHPQETRS